MAWLCTLAACSVPVETFTPVDNTPMGDNDYLKASNTNPGDHFGLGIALTPDGSVLIVGANTEASAITGDPTNNDAQGAGAAYAFIRSNGTWIQDSYIKASNPGLSDEFGLHVALSRDGSTLAIGAYHEASGAMGIDGNQLDDSKAKSGAVYVFRRTAGAWTQEAYIKASNPDIGDFFGWVVALSSDGSTLAVGARHEDSNSKLINSGEINGSATDAGAVYVFTRQGTVWTQQAYIKSTTTASYQELGRSVALSADGSLLAAGAPGDSSSQGAVFVFARAGTVWTQQAALKASNAEPGDQFGEQISLTPDGAQLAVAAVGEDSAATGAGGDKTDNSAAESGAVYMFARSSGTWNETAYLKASNAEAGDSFGIRVALSDDGSVLAVAAPAEASAAKGINGNETDNAILDAGAVYVFTRDPAWSQRSYVKASNTDSDDRFGEGMGLSGDGKTLVVGAWQEDGASTGVDGDQTSNGAPDSGAAYVFTSF
ncbi:MAG TPA: hypothetical protein VIV40_42840 [Kofleriaceae bacterium]